jgi:RNA polymerase sigma factor (sigma-70 family)
MQSLAEPDKNRFISSIASQYGRRLRRFLSVRLRNPADVPDLAQEVFLRLLRVDRRDAIRSPEAYLFTVASHVIHQHTLRQSAVPPTVDIEDVFAELHALPTDDPESRADTQQRIDALTKVLEKLPPALSAALILHRFEGLSIEEIGRKLGVARPTAKKYLARALLYCREHQKPEE